MPENAPSEDRRDGKNSVRRAILASPAPSMRAEEAGAPPAPQGRRPCAKCHVCDMGCPLPV